ncbi:MAG: hypothetical protein R3C45_12595 [Phycisphaerales bacterium]
MDADLDSGATLVSWVIDGPQAVQILAFQDGTTSQGSDWVQGYFDGKEQWIAITGSGVNGGWDIAQYASGLDLSVFGQVEFGLRHTNGNGETGFTDVAAPATLEGDLNTDGFVGIGDLNIVLGNWNINVPPGDARADPSGDGFVGIEDLNRVLGNWNAGTPPAERVVVPEASCVSLFGMGCLALARRGRRFTGSN